MGVLRRVREWRVDRLTDRRARRPSGRRARHVYGAEDAHAFLWEPVLEGLALDADDRLLDIGCGGGVFLRHALESGCTGVGLDHSRAMVRLARKRVGGAAQIVHGKAEALPFADAEFSDQLPGRILLLPRPSRSAPRDATGTRPATRPDRDRHQRP